MCCDDGTNDGGEIHARETMFFCCSQSAGAGCLLVSATPSHSLACLTVTVTIPVHSYEPFLQR